MQGGYTPAIAAAYGMPGAYNMAMAQQQYAGAYAGNQYAMQQYMGAQGMRRGGGRGGYNAYAAHAAQQAMQAGALQKCGMRVLYADPALCAYLTVVRLLFCVASIRSLPMQHT